MDHDKNSAQHKSQVVSSCLAFLKEATGLAKKQFDSSDFPTSTVTVRIFEPSGPGSYCGKTLEFAEMDMPLILHSLEKDLQSGNSWNLARMAIESYIEANDIKPESVFFHDVGDHYLWPLLRSYFEDQKSFLYNSSRSRKKIAHLLKHLDASSTQVFGLVALEGFSAPRAFSLDRSIRVRPISETDIRMLGRNNYVVPPGRYRFPNPLCDDFPLVHSDWWICEIELPNSRGTADGYNRLHSLMDLLTLALRIFKEGSFSSGMVVRGPRGEFGRTGVGHNRKMQRYSAGGAHTLFRRGRLKHLSHSGKNFVE